MEIFISLVVFGLVIYGIMRSLRAPEAPWPTQKTDDDHAVRNLVRALEAEQNAKERLAAHHVEVPPKPFPAGAGVAAFIDVETTGLNAHQDEIVELAVELFAFDRNTGELHEIVDFYCGLREPAVPISPGASAVNGITMAMVRGQRLDNAKVRSLLNRADFFIAHNASFDRKFAARLFPVVESKPWFCSMRDVDWYTEGCQSRSLISLLSTFGVETDQIHRAGADTAAAVMLLSKTSSNGRPFMWQVLKAHKENPLGRGAPAGWARDSAKRYRKAVFETHKETVSAGPVSITFSQSVRKQRDPKPVIDDLLTLLRDLIADGSIDQVEAWDLNEWLTRNGDLVDTWPLNVLAARMGRIVADGRIEPDELEELRELVLEVTHPEALAQVDLSKTSMVPVTQPPPKVIFPGKVFVFTGKCLFGTRAACEQAVIARDGSCKTSVTNATDYLIVGMLRSTDWVASTHGRKIQRAIENLRAGRTTAIILEEHWARALTQAQAASA